MQKSTLNRNKRKILKKELKAMRVSKYALYTNIDTVDWNKKEKVEEWRSSWAEHANRYLENWKPISFFITWKKMQTILY